MAHSDRVALDIHAQTSILFGLTVLRLSLQGELIYLGLAWKQKAGYEAVCFEVGDPWEAFRNGGMLPVFLYNSDPQGIFLQEQSCPSASNSTALSRPPCFVTLWTPDHALIV